MKKIIMMVALAFTTLTMSAQEDSKWQGHVGVGMATLVGDNTDGDKAAFSYKVGVTYDIAISESFSVIPGVELVNKAFKEDGIKGTINMFYAQIPVLAAYKFNVSDNARVTVKAGPYASYGISGSDLEFYTTIGTIKKNIFGSDMFDRFDAGIKAGASVDFNAFSVGVEYSRGLKKMKSDVKAYTQAVGLVLGYRF